MQEDFDRQAYISQIGIETRIPEDFETWLMESTVDDIIGWLWPGLRDEHKKERFEELGLDWVDGMTFSRHLKPGYTLLSTSRVINCEDPDKSVHNSHNQLHYSGSWQKTRPTQSRPVRALLVWADLSGYCPRITLLILDGSDHWDGTVWLTETMSPRFEATSSHAEVGLMWIEPLGSWTSYLENECKALRRRFLTLPQYKSYRSGGRVWMRQAC
jgi:hypothetical protein